MPRRKLSKPTDQRVAMLRNLATSLLRSERVETTEPRAKELRKVAERMITLAKENTLASRRRALSYLYDEDVVKKLFDEIGPRFAERQGGYTRIIKKGPRRGDGAPIAIIELVEEE